MSPCRWCMLLRKLNLAEWCRPCWRAQYHNRRGAGPDYQKRR